MVRRGRQPGPQAPRPPRPSADRRLRHDPAAGWRPGRRHRRRAAGERRQRSRPAASAERAAAAAAAICRTGRPPSPPRRGSRSTTCCGGARTASGSSTGPGSTRSPRSVRGATRSRSPTCCSAAPPRATPATTWYAVSARGRTRRPGWWPLATCPTAAWSNRSTRPGCPSSKARPATTSSASATPSRCSVVASSTRFSSTCHRPSSSSRLDGLPWARNAWGAGAGIDALGTAVARNLNDHRDTGSGPLFTLMGWLTARVDPATRHVGSAAILTKAGSRWSTGSTG